MWPYRPAAAPRSSSGATRPHRAYHAPTAARLAASRHPKKRSGGIARRPATGDPLDGEADIRGAASLAGGVHKKLLEHVLLGVAAAEYMLSCARVAWTSSRP